MEEQSRPSGHGKLKDSPDSLYSRFPLSPNSRSIRLLEIEPVQIPVEPDLPPQLYGHLRVVSFEEEETRPSFVAVSYVWGERWSPTRRSIICHGVHIDITDNCWAALCQIRRRHGYSSSAILWVDSICISQDNEKEKLDQIPLMQDIFSLAQSTYVWLGDGDDKSGVAMEYLVQIARFGRQLPLRICTAPDAATAKIESARYREAVWGAMRFRLKHREPTRRNVHLDEVLDREWIHRSWTFQELILARQLVVLCGTQEISWEELISAVSLMAQNSMGTFRTAAEQRERAATYPVSPAVLAHWQSMIDLWLGLPRPSHGPDRSTRKRVHVSGNNHSSLRDDIIAYWDRYGDSPFIFRLFHWTVTALGLLFAMGIWAFLVRSLLQFDGVYSFRIGPPILLVWLIVSVILGMRVRKLYLLWYSIGFGQGQTWLRDSATGTESLQAAEVLDGIRAALRERVSTQPHDKAFSIIGIVQASGASTTPPKYSLSKTTTYLTLLKDLLAWRPEALILLMDGGGNMRGHDPEDGESISWVPDWSTPRPSAWLTSRYRLDNTFDITPGCDFQLLEPSGLLLAGNIRGIVSWASQPFASTYGLQGSTLHFALAANLHTLHYWHLMVYKDLFRSNRSDIKETWRTRQFAVLEGLVRSLNNSRPEYWQISEDFPDRRDDFQGFCQLLEILDKSSHPSDLEIYHTLQDILTCDRNSSPSSPVLENTQPLWDSVLSKMTRIIALLRRNKKAWRYFIKTTNQLALDGRNLFLMSVADAYSDKLVGSGPLGLAEGDSIFLSRGIPTPMALRKVPSPEEEEHHLSARGDGRFEVVGAVFVHTLTSGQHWDPRSSISADEIRHHVVLV
ncbi:heterokaryon incompatibility protein-domain-containing protein [Triangularia verruculosa]|uniref:Heterokaryon incompatibility protein-domain-containing protein n=1 Tax=Triangularia verruculosa TaxID=2587418 RepID=A0AAN7AQM0_9PEZI|nr:heterokaryon incompatibility protein-domain-containing protein [Triangularia verruculosa]